MSVGYSLFTFAYAPKRGRMAYLICDEPPAGEPVTHYVLFGFPDSPIEVPADPDPTKGFAFCLDGMPKGDYEITAKACFLDGDGVSWCSLETSAAFTFTILNCPMPPTGFAIAMI